MFLLPHCHSFNCDHAAHSALGSPLWAGNVRLRPPAAQQLFLADPPWRKCGGGCSRWWWQRLGEPCAAAAAGRCRFYPNGRRCEGASGPPEIEERKGCTGQSNAGGKPEPRRLEELRSRLTLAMASTSAPFLSKQRTTSICPARAAMWRAVSPRWRKGQGRVRRLFLRHLTSSNHTHNVTDVRRRSVLEEQ